MNGIRDIYGPTEPLGMISDISSLSILLGDVLLKYIRESYEFSHRT